MMLAVAVIPFFSSCDYLDKEPDDMLTIDAVFDNADYTKQWLAGVYNLVPDPLWEYMNFAGYGYYMMSDETQMASSLGQFGWGNLGSPDKSGGKFFNSIENLHLCTMNNQGLLALAQLILPSEILSNFEVVRVEEEASLIRIYLDESVKAEYKENPEIESKGFCEAVTIRDFPIRDKGVDLIVRRRKWYDKQNNRYFSDSYDLKAEETRYSKEFAAFLKGVYGDDSYDLPFA